MECDSHRFLLCAGLGSAQLQGIVDIHVHGDPDARPPHRIIRTIP